MIYFFFSFISLSYHITLFFFSCALDLEYYILVKFKLINLQNNIFKNMIK